MEYPVRTDTLGLNGNLDGIFTPDHMMASQYFAGVRRSLCEPEQRLALAVLESAIRDLRGTGATQYRQSAAFRRSEAVAWLLSAGNEPFSFEFVCEMLVIEPGYLRKGLLTWRGELKRCSPNRPRPVVRRAR